MIYFANHRADFFMIGTSVMKELKSTLALLPKLTPSKLCICFIQKIFNFWGALRKAGNTIYKITSEQNETSYLIPRIFNLYKWKNLFMNYRKNWVVAGYNFSFLFEQYTGWPIKMSLFFFGNNFYKKKKTFKIFSPQTVEVYRIFLV